MEFDFVHHPYRHARGRGDQMLLGPGQFTVGAKLHPAVPMPATATGTGTAPTPLPPTPAIDLSSLPPAAGTTTRYVKRADT